MEKVMDKNDANKKAQIKYSGTLLRHWYWCVLVTLLMLLLTAVVLYVDTLAGCIVGVFTAFMFLTLLLLELYYRPRVLIELLDFTHRFGGSEKEILKTFAIPYAIIQPDGRLLWMNDAMMEITHKNEHYHKNIAGIFPQISASVFDEGETETTIELEHEEHKYQVCMKYIQMNELIDDLSAVEKNVQDCYVIALHFFDITELSKCRQENYDQKSAVGLLYMDNYDEVMDEVEDVRRSMLDALVDRRITKYISSMGGLIKKLEKDKYLLVVNRRGLAQMEEDRFSVLEEVKTVNLGNAMNVTVSIGIGTGMSDYMQNYEMARGMIEMALA
jgi:c-di-AMP phosphodiesterase-like protein